MRGVALLIAVSVGAFADVAVPQTRVEGHKRELPPLGPAPLVKRYCELVDDIVQRIEPSADVSTLLAWAYQPSLQLLRESDGHLDVRTPSAAYTIDLVRAGRHWRIERVRPAASPVPPISTGFDRSGAAAAVRGLVDDVLEVVERSMTSREAVQLMQLDHFVLETRKHGALACRVVGVRPASPRAIVHVQLRWADGTTKAFQFGLAPRDGRLVIDSNFVGPE